MAKIKVTLPGLEIPVDGKQVSFVAPCDCSAVDGIQIDGVDYDVVDSIGNVVPFGKGVWGNGAVLTVTLDVTNRKAYLQNQNSYTKLETLSDGTKVLYELEADAVPDDAFVKAKSDLAAEMSKVFGYVWRGREISAYADRSKLENADGQGTSGSTSSGGATLYWSRQITVDGDANISLVDPTATGLTYNTNSLPTDLATGAYFFKHGYPETGKIYYFDPSVSGVTITHSSRSGLYTTYLNYTNVALVTANVGEYEYLFSEDMSAHPTGSVVVGESTSDGYDGYHTIFYGSIAKNAMAYYQLNTAAVLNALLGLEG